MKGTLRHLDVSRARPGGPRRFCLQGRCRFASLVLIALLLPLAGISAAGTIEFTRIRPEYREDASFKRISEFFTGRENTGGRVVLRTQPASRDGFYFSFRLTAERGSMVPEGTVALLVFTPGSYEPTEFTFELEAQDRHSLEAIIGLTGSDWSAPDTRPVAWRLEFRDASGQSIGFKESFLWRLPAEDQDG